MPLSAIEYINSVQSLWIASKSWVGRMSKREAQSYASSERLQDQDYAESEPNLSASPTVVPWFFDSRSAWPGCVGTILDQGQCGSCWAFAATEVLSDRFCISSAGTVQVTLSPQYLVSCDPRNFGCQGGYIGKAWNFMKLGLPELSCINYNATDVQECPTRCDNGGALEMYKVRSVKAYRGPSAIQMALMTGGPVETGFDVYADFYSYSSGIYAHTYGGFMGGHAVKIVGWGYGSGVNYWICANSWGTDWGMQGFFNIQFGQCEIDLIAYAGTPLV